VFTDINYQYKRRRISVPKYCLMAEQYRSKDTKSSFQKVKCIVVPVVSTPVGGLYAEERICFSFRYQELKVERLLLFAE